ncbi:tetratricopeptide repeat protein [Neorhodopirellula lusitana]|uniref:tetratricopeptide repeat protein n=1 Tax=Neorhodopirellula lusitana TaxID=445327 RepID=UPI00384EFB90
MFRYLNPLAWTKWFGQFIFCWIRSIPWKRVGAGVPALILTAALILLAFLAYSDGGSWRRGVLASQIQNAIEIEDFESAELLLKRQMKEGDSSTDTLFRLALAQDQLDEQDQANQLMRELAFRRNSERAAMWLIQQNYLGKGWGDLDSTQQNEFGELLELVVEKQPKNAGMRQLYANYLIAGHRYAAAIPHLQQLAELNPMLGLQAAALSRQVGDDTQSERLASVTLDRVSKLFTEEPANPKLALAVAQIQLFSQEHADAIRTLSKSIPRMKTPEHRAALQQAMGDAIAAWVNVIEKEKNETPVERLRVLKMLQVALEHAPNNPRVLTLVSDQVLKTAENDDESVQALRSALVEGTSPGIAHFIRGTSALMADDMEKAEQHLSLAAKHLPNSTAILNNLAVALTQREGGDLEKALQLSNQAIESQANASPYFYETRGQILFRMEKYLDAIPDLEKALSEEKLAAGVHEVLAKCYEKIDDPKMAAEHRKAFERLSKKSDEK